MLLPLHDRQLHRRLDGNGALNFSQYFLNSLVISALSIIGNVIACSLTAYAFARLDFPFKRVLFALLLGTLLLPYHVTLVPQYVAFNQLGLINTFVPLDRTALPGDGCVLRVPDGSVHPGPAA